MRAVERIASHWMFLTKISATLQMIEAHDLATLEPEARGHEGRDLASAMKRVDMRLAIHWPRPYFDRRKSTKDQPAGLRIRSVDGGAHITAEASFQPQHRSHCSRNDNASDAHEGAAVPGQIAVNR